VTEARECEQVAQSRYRAGIKPGTSGLPVRHATVTPLQQHYKHTKIKVLSDP